MDKWTHHVRHAVPLKDPNGLWIAVEAGLHHISGNDQAYFSITGEIWKPGKSDVETCGAIHEEISKYFPEFRQLIQMHLSGEDGAPMHAVENGWYWLAGYYGGAGERFHGGNSDRTKSKEECLKIFADHIRVDVSEARFIAKRLTEGRTAWGEVKNEWKREVERMRPRWKQEAEEAIKILDHLAKTANGKHFVPRQS